jgi:nitrogen fixation NifU-like protein
VYSPKVIELFQNPKNVGSFDEKEPNVGTGVVGSPACGDVMQLQIKVNDQGIIEDARFKTFGCGSAIASASLATEWLKGKTLEEARKIKNVEIAKELDLPPIKIHCSVLAEDAIKNAIEDLMKRRGDAQINAGREAPAAETASPSSGSDR